MSVSHVEGCGAAETAGLKVGFGRIGVEGRGSVACRVWRGDGAAVGIGDVGPCPIGPAGGIEWALEFGEE